MDTWMYACLAIGLILLAVPAGALVPDTIIVETDTGWVTAGSPGAATLTVQVSNSTSGNTSFAGVAVNLAVNSTYGSISPACVETDANGTATAVFTPGTHSGNVTIAATAVHGELAVPLTGSVDQRVDHAAPAAVAGLWYEPEVTVGEQTSITVRMVDCYGNVVDSRNTAETVVFMVGSPSGSAVFVGGTDEITVPVDAAGNATATLQVDTVAGENLVWIQPPAPVRSEYISITGVGGLPASIVSEVNPTSASVPADGESVISFTYTLLDEYKNPAAGQGLWINSSVKKVGREDEHQSYLLNSNSLGQVMITYGPEDSVGVVTITATAHANPDVTNSTVVEFTSTDPVNILLSASPQSMPSRDVKLDVVSELRAKVMDVRGNPVEGENVTFAIDTGSTDVGEYNQTGEPYLKAEGLITASAETNADGYAIVEFYPGAFSVDEDAPNWSDTATGTCDVVATWNGIDRLITLTWKNYPYLSVETEVSPETVAVNETVDVTIRLKGDGWALQPDPIDVVLVIDRSSSMTKTDVSPSRIEAAKSAAQIFVGEMNQDRDRIGLVSYCALTSRDLPLTDDYLGVNSTITGLRTARWTGTRNGLYVAIQEMVANKSSNPDAVHAVILMSDGEYNYYGDPLARGTGDTERYDWTSTKTDEYTFFPDLGGSENWGGGLHTNQNMSIYAANNDIHLYMISFSNDISEGSSTWKTMDTLAKATGGKHYHAITGADLARVYTDIAGELRTEAGVDTTMDVVFENVQVNEDFPPGNTVFDYVHEDRVSTTIESWIENSTGRYEVMPLDTRNDAQNWTASPPRLSFDVGTIHLNQVWETTFLLKVKMDGNINVFGPGSNVTFNNGEDMLELPDTFITALADLNNTGLMSSSISVELAEPVLPAGQEAFFETVPLTWNITYNGTCDIDEALAYSDDGGLSWSVFLTETILHGAMGNNTWVEDSTLFDISELPSGVYLIRVVSSAPDTAEALDTTNAPVRIGNASGAFIRIG